MIQLDDDSIITLTDDQGIEVDFLLLDVVEYDEKDFLVLLPLEDEADEEDNVLILQAVRNGDEESYIGVEDETVLNAVFNLFTQQLEADAEAAGLTDDDDEEAPEAE